MVRGGLQVLALQWLATRAAVRSHGSICGSGSEAGVRVPCQTLKQRHNITWHTRPVLTPCRTITPPALPRVTQVAAAAAQQAEAMEGVLFQGTPGTPEVSGPGTGLGSGAGSFVGPFAALVPAPLTHGVSGALHGVAAWASAFQADGLSSFLSRVEASGVGAHTAVDDAPEQPAYNIPMRRLSTPSSALSGPAARPARASPPHAASSPSPSPSPSLDTVPTPKSSVRVRGRPITGAPSSEPVIQSAAPSRHDEQHMSGDQQGRGYSNGVVGQDHSRRSVSPPSHTSPASLSGQSPAPAHVSHYAQPASHSAQLSARDHALARSPSLRAPAPTNLDYLPSRRSPGAPGAHHGPRSRSSVARAGSSDGSSASGSSEWGSSQEEGSMVGGDLSGVWEKDAQASDAESYEAMMDLLGLSGLQRVTARLIEGLEVVQSEEGLRVTFLTVVPFFKVGPACCGGGGCGCYCWFVGGGALLVNLLVVRWLLLFLLSWHVEAACSRGCLQITPEVRCLTCPIYVPAHTPALVNCPCFVLCHAKPLLPHAPTSPQSSPRR